MSKPREVLSVTRSLPTIEGAGVHLKRAFGFRGGEAFDPFLLLDDFRSDNPRDYSKGFPWHPHRGIETITYVINGRVEHMDSMGNRGVIGPGDVQWMTAGSGIIHQEMPMGDGEGRMGGFQLWANLPAARKMMPPRYRDIKSGQIPEVVAGNARVRIICGEVEGTRGPIRDIVIDPTFLDVTVPKLTEFTLPTRAEHTVFAYVIGGEGFFAGREGESGARAGTGRHSNTLEPVSATNEEVVLFGEGDQVAAYTEDEPVRFLLLSGPPLREPVAWEGPIVMNTREELRTAFDELRDETFIKHKKA